MKTNNKNTTTNISSIITEKDSIIASLQDRISSLNDKCNNLNQLLADKSAEIDEKNKTINDLIDDNADKVKKLDKLRLRNKSFEKDVFGTAKSFKELKDKYEGNERELTKLSNDVNLYKQYMTKYDKLLKKHKNSNIIILIITLIYFITLLIFVL